MYWKKSSRVMLLGPTTSVSISEPGPITPSLKLPNVSILPPAVLTLSSARPCALQTVRTNSSVID
jgi:hypothetical protein